jgi:hypothetical protein
MFHVNDVRLSSNASLRSVIPVTTPEHDNEEFGVFHMLDVCMKPLIGPREKYLLSMPHFDDDDIPHVWHRLNDVHRTKALQEFLETPQCHAFAQTLEHIDFMHARRARIHESH